MCLPVPWEFGKSYVRAAELMQIKQMFGFFFFRLLFFFLERKEEYGKAMKKIAGCIWDFHEKKIPGIRDQTPLQDPDTYLTEDKAKQTRFGFFR